MSELKGSSFSLDRVVYYGSIGKNVGITINHDILKEAPEPDFLYADNVKYGSYTPWEYDPKGEVQFEINIAEYPENVEVYLDCSQEDFITLVRYLNNMKNKLLKLRREYDERNAGCLGNEKSSRG